MEASYTIARYGLSWDGGRICWPTSAGLWKRALTDNLDPKVICPAGDRGLLGVHLLGAASDGLVVITEGDYAAASIPLPWVGVAIGGKRMNDHQIQALLLHGIREVVLCLDGDAGRDVGITRAHLMRNNIEGLVARGLVDKQGPDDVPVPQRIDMLLEAE